MTKCLLYMAPIVLIGLVDTEAPAATAAWSGSIDQNITANAPEGTGEGIGIGDYAAADEVLDERHDRVVEPQVR